MPEKNIDKTKRQPTKWKKIFLNDRTNKGLIYKRRKQFIQYTIQHQENKQSN